MTRIVTARTACVLAVSFAAGYALGADGIRQAELDALVTEIEATGALWLEDNADDRAIKRKLKAVTYDAESAELLKNHLLAVRKDPVDLYVTNRLLKPMLMAKREVIREILPTVERIRARVTVRPFPDNAQKLKQEKGPDAAGRASVEKTEKDAPAGKTSHSRKLERDKLIAKHSSEVAALTRRTAQLMLRADTPEYDARVVKLLTDEERAGRASFLAMLDAVAADASDMNKDRARFYHGQLREFGLGLLTTVKRYTDYTKPVVSARGSYYEEAPAEKDFCPAIKVLESVNLFASKAKMPAVKVPSKAQIVGDAMLQEARRLLSSGGAVQRQKAKMILSDLVKRYPASAAAKKARPMLKALHR